MELEVVVAFLVLYSPSLTIRRRSYNFSIFKHTSALIWSLVCVEFLKRWEAEDRPSYSRVTLASWTKRGVCPTSSVKFFPRFKFSSQLHHTLISRRSTFLETFFRILFRSNLSTFLIHGSKKWYILCVRL